MTDDNQIKVMDSVLEVQKDKVRVTLNKRKEQLFLQLYNKGDRFSEWEKEICISLMQEGHEEQNKNVYDGIIKIQAEKLKGKPDEKRIGEIAKSIILPVVEEIRNYDTAKLADCPEDELLERNEELQRLAGLATYLEDLAKYRDPDTQDSIGESVYQGRKHMFSLKTKMIKNYADRARIYAMLRAYRNNTLTEQSFTQEEITEIRRINNLSNIQKITPDHMKLYVDEMMRESQLKITKDYNSYFSNDEVQDEFSHRPSFEPERLFKEIEKKIDRVVDSVLGGKYDKMSDEEEKAYWSRQNKIKEINAQIQELQKIGGQEEQIQNLQKEVEKLTEEAELLEIHQALMVRGFSVGNETKFQSALIRSFAGLQAFAGMSDDDMLTMMKDLSAGHFDKKRQDITPDEIEAYKAMNIQGLQTYKKWISEYYSKFERILNHRHPSIEYCEEHFEELRTATAGTQEDFYVVRSCNEVMDPQNEEDRKLRLYINNLNNIVSEVTVSIFELYSGQDYSEKVTRLQEFDKQLAQQNKPVFG